MQGNVITHRETSADVTDVGLWLCGSWLFTLPDMALGFSICDKGVGDCKIWCIDSLNTKWLTHIGLENRSFSMSIVVKQYLP